MERRKAEQERLLNPDFMGFQGAGGKRGTCEVL